MTVEELLKPRYKVVADYPFSNFQISEILYFHNNDGGWGNEGCYSNSSKFPNPNHRLFPPGQIEKYPHLFKKLEWWEERKESDMPEYVRNVADRKVFRVLDNEIMSRKSYTSKEIKVAEGVFTFYHSLSDCLPATKEEYENQKTIE